MGIWRTGRLTVAVWAAWIALVTAGWAQTTRFVDDDAPNDPAPGDPRVSDPNEDGSSAHPFDAIQEGIAAAAPGDTVLVADGAYSGPGNRGLDYGGKAITVISASGPAVSVISGEGNGRIVRFHSGEGLDSVLDGFTIMGGRQDIGGGVLCDAASPTIRNCIIRLCTAEDKGGGIACLGGSAVLRDCVLEFNHTDDPQFEARGAGVYLGGGTHTLTNVRIINNHSVGAGGGLFLDGSRIALIDCEISRNTARGSGGGIIAEPANGVDASSVTLLNCMVAQNRSNSDGAGVFIDGGVLEIYRGTFVDNWGQARSGALHIAGGAAVTLAQCVFRGNRGPRNGGAIGVAGGSEVDASRCEFEANVGEKGGAVFGTESRVRILDSTFTGNTASFRGGAIFGDTCDVELVNVTLSANVAEDVGGALCAKGPGARAWTVRNAILWGDAAGAGAELAIVQGGAVSVLYSDVARGLHGAFVDGSSALQWGDGNLEADPRFVAPSFGDVHLRANSPCIDAGDPDTDGTGAADIDGDPRAADGRIDMGADEFTTPRYPPGDMNCDGAFNGADIDAFFLALDDPDRYGLTYPACDRNLGDFDSDGSVDGADIGPFFECLGRPDCP